MENKIVEIQAIVKDIDAYLANKNTVSEIPAIELDIILEKTRNLYDILTKLKANTCVVEEKHEEVVVTQQEETPVFQQQETDTENEPVLFQIETQEQAQPNEEVGTQHEPESIQFEPTQVQETPQIEQQPVIEQPVNQVIETAQNPIQNNENRAQSIGEALQSRNTQQDLGSKLGETPIKDINTAIPLGDRFSIQAQLFGRNDDKMRETINTLNNFNNYEEAIQFIKDNFNWNFEDKKVQKFLGIVKRRFL